MIPGFFNFLLALEDQILLVFRDEDVLDIIASLLEELAMMGAFFA
jgi:hypothetical protein